MRHTLFIILLVATIISTGCLNGNNEKNNIPTKTQTPIPTLTSTPNVTFTTLAYQNQINNPLTKIDCTPPRLKIGFIEFESQFVSQDLSCVGIRAPIFTVPEYPAGPIVNHSVVGKFYWWSNLGYCEFRDDGIWILYAWDNQSHYYPGKWEKSKYNTYSNGEGYNVEIVRPSAMGSSNYTEKLALNYNPEKDRLYLKSYDGIEYENTDAWIGRRR